MPITLSPMTPPDAPAQTALMNAAFGPDLMSVFYPTGCPPDAAAHMTAENVKTIQKAAAHPDELLFVKAVEADGQVVATAKWEIHARPRTEAELDREEEEGHRDPPPGANAEAMGAFFGELGRKRREIFGGEPYMLLSILVVHPGHQRKGLGAMLLENGLRRADELGLRAYLESSPKGKGLYAKWGFEEVGVMDFDAREWGRDENVVHTLMIRPARK